jgi:hypothetical protein
LLPAQRTAKSPLSSFFISLMLAFIVLVPVLVWRPRYILGFMGDTLPQPARIVQVKK